MCDEAADRGAQPYQRVADFAQPARLALHLFAGHRRPDDLHEWLERCGHAAGVSVLVVSVDLA
eukprot:7409011-Lingulodinium_polyedra.AAC.1